MSDVRLQNDILEIWGSGNRLELAGGTRGGPRRGADALDIKSKNPSMQSLVMNKWRNTQMNESINSFIHELIH